MTMPPTSRRSVPHLAGVRAGDPAVSRSIGDGRASAKMLQDASAFAAEDEAAAKPSSTPIDAVDYDFNTIKRMLAAEIAADLGKVDAALDVLGWSSSTSSASATTP